MGLDEIYQRDQRVWDECADIYEDRIVRGHPDVLAYEAFEEDFLDRVLLCLCAELKKPLRLYDVGCGSARLHLRYGMKTIDAGDLTEPDAERVRILRQFMPEYEQDPLLSRLLHSIGGIDFSSRMLKTAEIKLRDSGLGSILGKRLTLEHGSAFDLQAMDGGLFPVVVSVCNSIGVMQGPEGASELFKSLRRTAETAGGIAIISGYRREAVETFALGNYESTMDVCGQPRWLVPETYAAAEYRQVPRCYKRAYDPDPTLTVDVYDRKSKLIETGHVLTRNQEAVRQTIETGHIRTHSSYESRWYSFAQFDQWIASHWSGCRAYHIAGNRIDALRGAPAQLAILDISGMLGGLLERWSVCERSEK